MYFSTRSATIVSMEILNNSRNKQQIWKFWQCSCHAGVLQPPQQTYQHQQDMVSLCCMSLCRRYPLFLQKSLLLSVNLHPLYHSRSSSAQLLHSRFSRTQSVKMTELQTRSRQNSRCHFFLLYSWWCRFKTKWLQIWNQFHLMGFIGQRTQGGVNKVWKEKAKLVGDFSGQSETPFL